MRTPDSPRRHAIAGLFGGPLPGDRRFKSGGGQTSTSTTEPWPAQQESLKRGFLEAEQNVLDRPLDYFPESTVIPFAPETTAALGATTTRALRGSPLLGGAQEYTGDVLAGRYADPRNNPYLAGVSDAVLSEVIPAVSSTFGRAGRTGGSPLELEAVGRGVSRGMAPTLAREYGRERGAMEAAAGRAPGLAREDYTDIGQLARVGAVREGKAGEGLSDQLARWNFAQSEPTNRIAQFMSLVQGNYGGTSTASTRTESNPLATILGAGLGLAGMAGGFPTAGGGSVGASVLGK